METVIQVGPTGAEQARFLPKTVRQDNSRKGSATDVRPTEPTKPAKPTNETLGGLRLLVAYRQDLVADEAEAIARVRESLAGLFPSLERRLNWTSPSSVILVARYQTPDHVRRAGPRRIRAYLRRRHVWNADYLSAVATEAASEQTERLQAEGVAAQIVANLASDALQLREQIDRISRSQRGAHGWLGPSRGRHVPPISRHDAGRRLGDAC
jgi:hypothetical protein